MNAKNNVQSISYVMDIRLVPEIAWYFRPKTRVLQTGIRIMVKLLQTGTIWKKGLIRRTIVRIRVDETEIRLFFLRDKSPGVVLFFTLSFRLAAISFLLTGRATQALNGNKGLALPPVVLARSDQ